MPLSAACALVAKPLAVSTLGVVLLGMSFDGSVLAAVLVIYAVVVVSPGPAFALTTRVALSSTRHRSAGVVLGLAMVAVVYAIAAMSGLSVLITNVGWLARAVQMAGATYLVWLGVGMWRSSPVGAGDEFSAPELSPGKNFLNGLRLGVVVQLANPKAIAFFVGLFAVAVPPDTNIATRVVVLAMAFALEVGWYWLVTLMLSRRRLRAVYQRYAQALDRMIGSFLIIVGVRLATDRAT